MLTLSRRRLGGLAGLAGVVATASACDPWDQSPSTTRRSADEILLDQVVADVRSARDLAQAHGNERVVAMHEVHLTALGQPTPATPSESPGSTSPTPSGPATGTVAPLDLATGEGTLKTQLVTAAIQAEDGALARVLASMAAAVAQQIEVLR